MAYDPVLVDLTPDEHSDAKEVADLIDALIRNDGTAAKEAVEAVLAVLPDMSHDDRFIHLFNIFWGAIKYEVLDKVLGDEEPPE